MKVTVTDLPARAGNLSAAAMVLPTLLTVPGALSQAGCAYVICNTRNANKSENTRIFSPMYTSCAVWEMTSLGDVKVKTFQEDDQTGVR